jgi:hypothetical protein
MSIQDLYLTAKTIHVTECENFIGVPDIKERNQEDSSAVNFKYIKNTKNILSSALAAEVLRATDAEAVIRVSLAKETADARDAESILRDSLAKETEDSQAVKNALMKEIEDARANEKAISDRLSAEILRANEVETTLKNQINALYQFFFKVDANDFELDNYN